MTIRKKAVGLTAVAVAAALALTALQQHRWRADGVERTEAVRLGRSAAAAAPSPTPRTTPSR